MLLVLLAVAWAIGLAAARGAWDLGLWGCHGPGPWTWAGLLVLPVAGLGLGHRWPRWRRPAGLLLCLLLGAARYQLHPATPCFAPRDLAFYNGTVDAPAWATVTGTVVRPPEPAAGRQRLRLRVDSLAFARGEAPRPVRGDALLSADRHPALHYGDRITVRGRLEAPPVFADFDYRAYLAGQGVSSMIRVPEVTLLARGQGTPFWQALYGLRSRGQAVIAQMLPEPEAALLTGILLGVESGIDQELDEQFNRTGVSHIIVISGSNVAIIAGVLIALFVRVIGRRRAFVPVVLGIVLYTLLVGADSAVTRAAIMGIFYAWATYLGRQSTAVVSLCASVMVMTAVNPLTLWDVGFQFSFAATLGLNLFSQRFTTWFARYAARLLPASSGPRHSTLAIVGDTVVITLAAQVLVLPLIAYRFGRWSLVSPLANLLVLPVQPAIMVWGGLAVMAGLVAELLASVRLAGAAMPLWWVARGLALVPFAALHWTVAVVQTLAPLPFASRQVAVGPAALVTYFAGIAGLLASARPTLPLLGSLMNRLRTALTSSAAVTGTGALLLLSCYLLPAVLNSQPDGRLHVHFLDVDRGEAILIVTPNGQQVLVDGGYDPEALAYALSRHMPFYDRQIELVVLTHPGDERVRGLAVLPERYHIQRVLQAPFPYPSAAYESWLAALQEAGVPITPAEAGLRIHLGYGIALDVLHPAPQPALSTDGQPDPPANSLVLRLAYGATSFLLLGDAPRTVQEHLLAAGLLGPATLVKLPAGGARAAFSHDLLTATRPHHAVVFAQRDERYRHLSPAVAAAWTAITGPQHFHRTDLAGTLSCASDGARVLCTP